MAWEPPEAKSTDKGGWTPPETKSSGKGDWAPPEPSGDDWEPLEPNTSSGGVATDILGAIGPTLRGASPWAAGAGIGAGIGAAAGGIGAVPGAIAGAGLVGLADLGMAIYNPIADIVGLPKGKSVKDITDEALTALGVPKTNTGTGRVIEAVAGGGAGGLAITKAAAQQATKVAPSVAKKVLNTLGQNPGGQIIAGATGSAAGQITAEGGGGPVAQFAAMLGGSIAPGVIASTPRSLLVGQTGQAASQLRAQRMRDIGVTPDAASTSPSIINRAATKTMSGTENLMAHRDAMIKKLGEEADRIASSVGRATSPNDAGRRIEAALTSNDKESFMQRTKAIEDQLWDKWWISAATTEHPAGLPKGQMFVPNTMKYLEQKLSFKEDNISGSTKTEVNPTYPASDIQPLSEMLKDPYLNQLMVSINRQFQENPGWRPPGQEHLAPMEPIPASQTRYEQAKLDVNAAKEQVLLTKKEVDKIDTTSAALLKEIGGRHYDNQRAVLKAETAEAKATRDELRASNAVNRAQLAISKAKDAQAAAKATPGDSALEITAKKLTEDAVKLAADAKAKRLAAQTASKEARVQLNTATGAAKLTEKELADARKLANDELQIAGDTHAAAREKVNESNAKLLEAEKMFKSYQAKGAIVENAEIARDLARDKRYAAADDLKKAKNNLIILEQAEGKIKDDATDVINKYQQIGRNYDDAEKNLVESANKVKSTEKELNAFKAAGKRKTATNLEAATKALKEATVARKMKIDNRQDAVEANNKYQEAKKAYDEAQDAHKKYEKSHMYVIAEHTKAQKDHSDAIAARDKAKNEYENAKEPDLNQHVLKPDEKAEYDKAQKEYNDAKAVFDQAEKDLFSASHSVTAAQKAHRKALKEQHKKANYVYGPEKYNAINFDLMKRLRTAVGDKMQADSLNPTGSGPALHGLYAAISEDIKMFAEKLGPEALKKYNRANQVTRGIKDRIKVYINNVNNRNPHEVWDYAVNPDSVRNGGYQFLTLNRSMSKAERSVFHATFIKHMGNDNGTFNPHQFVEKYKSLSPMVRSALLPGDQGKAAERLVRVIGDMTRGGLIKNHNDQAPYIGAGMLMVALLHAHPKSVLTVALSASKMENISKVLTSPAMIKHVSGVNNQPIANTAKAMNALANFITKKPQEEEEY